MKTRVVKAVGERAKDVVLATFHSFCETLLKEGDPNLLALEDVDHWILLRRNLARLKLEKYRRLAEPGQFLSDFVRFFSRCQDELVSSKDYQAFADQLAVELEGHKKELDEDSYKERAEQVALQHEIARAYRASEELLREKVLRLIFQQGFFKVRNTRLELEKLPGEIHFPYWLGFYGRRENLRCRVMDAVRRRIEGAKAAAFFEQWLAA